MDHLGVGAVVFLMVSGPFLIEWAPTPDKKVSRKVCVDSLAVWEPPE
jgi:hypothetical protein